MAQTVRLAAGKFKLGHVRSLVSAVCEARAETDSVVIPLAWRLRFAGGFLLANHVMSKEENREDAHKGAGIFSTTRWSVILTARDETAPEREEALEQLCRIYWKPLYVWLRHNNPKLTPQDAEDHIQGFFADLFERVALGKVDRAKGKFRSFLCASLNNYLANERVRANAQKRGGRFAFVSWDDALLEQTVQDAATGSLSPDKLLEQTWALALIGQVLGQLKTEHKSEAKSTQFEALQAYLTGDKGAVPYAETARRLGLGESAVKMAVQRMRRRFGELLREEVAHTVTRPEEVDEEIRALFAAVGS